MGSGGLVSTLVVLLWIGAGVAVAAAVMVVLNLRAWPRARPPFPPGGHPASPAGEGAFGVDDAVATPVDVAVLIPMRDEARNAAACLESCLSLAPPPSEIVVADDGSTDGTDHIIGRISEREPVVTALSCPPLPSGWKGKVHACSHLVTSSSATWLLHIDADTRLAPDALSQLGALVERYDADIVTAVPRQEMRSFMERVVMPMLHTIYACFIPTRLIWAHPHPGLLAANGQFMAIRRDALQALGGWRSVRSALVDDMQICRRAKAHGLRVVFADGTHLASCRMYRSNSEIWRGFSKNIAPGLGGSSWAVLGVIAVFICAFVLPFVAVGLALVVPEARGLLAAGLVGVVANLFIRLTLASRFSHPTWSAFLHPVASMYVAAMAFNSLLWLRRGDVHWKGRVYAS